MSTLIVLLSLDLSNQTRNNRNSFSCLQIETLTDSQNIQHSVWNALAFFFSSLIRNFAASRKNPNFCVSSRSSKVSFECALVTFFEYQISQRVAKVWPNGRRSHEFYCHNSNKSWHVFAYCVDHRRASPGDQPFHGSGHLCRRWVINLKTRSPK